jgi:hypothetical protein
LKPVPLLRATNRQWPAERLELGIQSINDCVFSDIPELQKSLDETVDFLW